MRVLAVAVPRALPYGLGAFGLRLSPQVILRYLTNIDDRFSSSTELSSFSSNQVPERFGYTSAVTAIVPCIFGAAAGILPTFNAMLISRSRAERREAMLHSQLRRPNERKYLTGPQKVSEGPAPNPAGMPAELATAEYMQESI